MRRLMIIITLALVAGSLAWVGWRLGTRRPLVPRREPPAVFAAATLRDAHGHTLPYRLLPPRDNDPHRRYPLLLFLHGSAERGRDNARQLRQIGPVVTAPAFRQQCPCYVVAPQCPAEDHWVHARYAGGRFIPSATPGPSMRLVLALIDTLQREKNIDPDRIYVTGLSMGGSGTWDLITRRPELFAAAVPLCGRGDTALARKAAHLPIWVFHGAQDPAVGVSWSRDMVAALRRAGAHPRYTEYPDLQHNCWTRAYREPALFSWLFAQRRQPR